jgi:NAD(P)-dependent dehydrogenase (short-subunit alcohol dehydrogenase family)
VKLSFDGLHCVVTGATGELGLAVARALLDAGAECHLPVRRELALDAFAAPARSRVHVTGGIDFADEHAVASFYADLPSAWASIHCAGAFTMQRIDDAQLDDLSKMVAANVAPVLVCTREAVRRMRSAKAGRIVNVAAAVALEPRAGAGMAVYTASKAAVAAFTEAVAEEVASDGVLVNAVAPSLMDTPANRRAMPNADVASWPKLDEVASTILVLASPQNTVTRGAIVSVRGRS